MLFRIVLIKQVMSFNKQDIYKALEGITAPGEGANLIESKAVTNVVIFGKEILVDVTITNPSLQAKKKVEVEIMKVIHDQVDEKTDVKVNVKVDAPAKPAPIKGNQIPGVKNIYIQPAMGDQGLSLGAALLAYSKKIQHASPSSSVS